MSIGKDLGLDIGPKREAVNEGTLNRKLPIEARFSFFSHKDIWIEFNRHRYHTFKMTLLRTIGDWIRLIKYKLGMTYPSKTLPAGIEKGPCIIIGSGPSLDQYIEELRDWKGGIMCSPSHATTLKYHGIDPTYIVIFDCESYPEEWFAKKWNYEKTSMILIPGTHPGVINMWKGRKYYYMIYDPFVQFWARVTPAGFGDMITTVTAPYAHTSPTLLSHAKLLGYGPIFAFGMDTGYPSVESMHRFTMWRYGRNKWEKDDKGGRVKNPNYKKWICSPPSRAADAEKEYGFVFAENGKPTNNMFMYYRKTFIACYWLEAVDVIDCTDGIMNGILPAADGHQVIRQQGIGFNHLLRTPEQIREYIEPWLAHNSTYYFWVEDPAEGDPLRKEGYLLAEIRGTDRGIIEAQTKLFIHRCNHQHHLSTRTVEYEVDRIMGLIEKYEKVKDMYIDSENWPDLKVISSEEGEEKTIPIDPPKCTCGMDPFSSHHQIYCPLYDPAHPVDTEYAK